MQFHPNKSPDIKLRLFGSQLLNIKGHKGSSQELVLTNFYPIFEFLYTAEIWAVLFPFKLLEDCVADCSVFDTFQKLWIGPFCMDIFCLTIARKIKIQDFSVYQDFNLTWWYFPSKFTHFAVVILQCFVSGRFALGLFVRQISLHSVLRVN